jgi:hypothetical protein
MAASEITTLPFHPQSQIEVVKTSDLAQLPLLQAARVWRESRKPYLGERTYLDYHQIKTLGKFFGEVPLSEIDADRIRAFQKLRMLRAGADSTAAMKLLEAAMCADCAPVSVRAAAGVVN